MVSFKPELCIIDQETWEMAQKRWEEVEGVWPAAKQPEKAASGQKSYVHSHPQHLLQAFCNARCVAVRLSKCAAKEEGVMAATMRRGKLVPTNLPSGRHGSRSSLHGNLKDVFLTAENLKYVYDNVEKEIVQDHGPGS